MGKLLTEHLDQSRKIAIINNFKLFFLRVEFPNEFDSSDSTTPTASLCPCHQGAVGRRDDDRDATVSCGTSKFSKLRERTGRRDGVLPWRIQKNIVRIRYADWDVQFLQS